jgi:hypothetical protein
MKSKRVPSLEECLQLVFVNSNEVKQAILAIRGSKLVNNSKFLQTMDSPTCRFRVNLRELSIIKKSSGSYLGGGKSDFEYVKFAKQAMQCKVVNDSKEMRSAIAHILWITDDRFIR